MSTLWQKKMSMLQNDNPCWYCEVIFWGHCKTEAELRLQSRECCVSDLLQQLQQTKCRRLNKHLNGHGEDWRHHRLKSNEKLVRYSTFDIRYSNGEVSSIFDIRYSNGEVSSIFDIRYSIFKWRN